MTLQHLQPRELCECEDSVHWDTRPDELDEGCHRPPTRQYNHLWLCLYCWENHHQEE